MLVGAVGPGAVVAELALDLGVNEVALGAEVAFGEVGAGLGRVEVLTVLVLAVGEVAAAHLLSRVSGLGTYRLLLSFSALGFGAFLALVGVILALLVAAVLGESGGLLGVAGPSAFFH